MPLEITTLTDAIRQVEHARPVLEKIDTGNYSPAEVQMSVARLAAAGRDFVSICNSVPDHDAWIAWVQAGNPSAPNYFTAFGGVYAASKAWIDTVAGAIAGGHLGANWIVETEDLGTVDIGTGPLPVTVRTIRQDASAGTPGTFSPATAGLGGASLTSLLAAIDTVI